MGRLVFTGITTAILTAAVSTVAWGDEVLFKNGDHLTGTVLSADGGKLKIKTAVAGEVTVDLKDVATFKTDKPLTVQLKDNTYLPPAAVAPPQPIPAPVTQPGGTVVADGKPVPLEQIKRINPNLKWTGSVAVNGNLARGNTHSEDLGVAADASLRRDDQFHNDRFSLAAAYNFGKQKDRNGVETTSADNWFASAKYDDFFTPKFYGYALIRYDHDRLAFLNYRLAPGVGVGYQRAETPTFHFSTEAGASYVYEDYSNDGSDDKIALRLAYHVDKKFNDQVSVFHNLEWLPAFDDPSDYNLIADAGVRAMFTKSFFTEFKVQYLRDSTPAPGALKNDTRFLLSLGWTF